MYIASLAGRRGTKKAMNFFRKLEMRSVECGIYYLPHSHHDVTILFLHNERNVPIIMAGCIAHARNGRISTSGLKSDVTILFLDPDFVYFGENRSRNATVRVLADGHTD